ncbi:AAA family ATPase [Ilyonectria robusta]
MAFERLVLDENKKQLIHALVDVHTSVKKMDDIIAGKGNGLIILLHGSPGTGKTLTAERFAPSSCGIESHSDLCLPVSRKLLRSHYIG